MVEERTSAASDGWRGVDEGWGRSAVEFATLAEPGNCREYVAMHHRLGLTGADRLLDIACGSGLSLELAALTGATCAGIDASHRLIAVAADRSPEADIRVGDMHALPWDDASFDVVTSFRGIWGTTPEAVNEVVRVLAPGGRVGLTVWGHIKASPGAWALAPFRLASETKVANQAAMVSLGRPGAGEELLAASGLVDIERVTIPFAWEFPDPETYARTLAASGPAYEAIQAIGEEAFLRAAEEGARERVREGLPLRATIDLVGYLARKPVDATPNPEPGYLGPASLTDEVKALYADDIDDVGYIMNATRVWAHRPELVQELFALLGKASDAGQLSLRQRGILVTATASTLGDAYCSLAWGGKLAEEAGDADITAGVLNGSDRGLTDAEKALAAWARKVVSDPNGTLLADVTRLRDAGLDDTQILGVTTFVALRVAFSSVNDALGAMPDRALVEALPEPVRRGVTWGRPVGTEPPSVV